MEGEKRNSKAWGVTQAVLLLIMAIGLIMTGVSMTAETPVWFERLSGVCLYAPVFVSLGMSLGRELTEEEEDE